MGLPFCGGPTILGSCCVCTSGEKTATANTNSHTSWRICNAPLIMNYFHLGCIIVLHML
jgi:hypothetical protein